MEYIKIDENTVKLVSEKVIDLAELRQKIFQIEIDINSISLIEIPDYLSEEIKELIREKNRETEMQLDSLNSYKNQLVNELNKYENI